MRCKIPQLPWFLYGEQTLMKLSRLSLTNFRNFSRLETSVPENITLITGNNAQGKTSILEAIYYLSTFSSFHAERDRELINFLELKNPIAVARIVADYVKAGQKHQFEIRIIKEQSKNGKPRFRKEILHDGVKIKEWQALGKFNSVMFLPQMMKIIEGSPSERRRFINTIIGQTNPHYSKSLSEYRKGLSQRNSLLKNLFEKRGDQDQLNFWDELLAKKGAEIIMQRITAIQELEQFAASIHNELTRGKEILHLAYVPSFDPHKKDDGQASMMNATINRDKYDLKQIESAYYEQLQKNRTEDIYRGQTSQGPHRDDIEFLSNGINLGVYGSRGQIRSTMLSLKLAEMDWIKTKTGEWPVLLLDEVLAELDDDRRHDLLDRVIKTEQSLLTTTDVKLFSSEFLENAERWQIQDGEIIPSK